MLTVWRGKSADFVYRAFLSVWLVPLGAKHPNWVIGYVGGKVEDGGQSFAGVRM